MSAKEQALPQRLVPVAEFARVLGIHEKPGKAKVEIRAAIARISKTDGISQNDAAEKLLGRVKKYAVQTKKRYGGEKTYITHPANWFKAEGYNSESLAGCPSDQDSVKYTDPASVYESPEYQGVQRSA